MRVTVLTAARPVSAERLATIIDTLRAADELVEVDVVSWGPVEERGAARSVTVIGPVRDYRSRAADGEAADPVGPGRDEVDAGSPAAPSAPDPSSAPVAPLPLARRARRLAGRPMWALRRRVILVRRSRPYRRTRRALLGGVARQFAAGTRARPDLLHTVRTSHIVLALDQYAVLAAWQIARRVPGPAVVNGLTAAQRELRDRAGTDEPGSARQ